MKYFFLILALVTPLAISITNEFQSWKQKYRKHYRSTNEEAYRYGIWKKSLDLVNRRNQANVSGFLMEVNQFADQIHIGNRKKLYYKLSSLASTSPFIGDVPDSFDWRKKGAVSPVKNQGQIGSALAYATIDCIESMHFIKTGQLVELSIHELVQCCNTSIVGSEFECVKKLGGLCDSASYPDSSTCQSSKCTPVAKVTDVTAVKHGDEEAMKVAVFKQPVFAAIDASHTSFQLYRSGIYYERACSSQRLDHAVLVVGYGSQGGKDFWIVKNSWGTEWGMNGYILMSRNRGNNCGIASSALIPVGI
ncbi:procathepsin L-like [Saccostrea echinata]|uniref:procathepsin L-like n=1 Tax=Saccostrea echinata TaxID=191078 RepID=UPI002A806F84|nr:procathepsin L-like [Saccostrea echinata]